MRTRQLRSLAEFMAKVTVEATHENREEALMVLQVARDILVIELAQEKEIKGGK